MPPAVLDRLVSEERARHVAEILFPDEMYHPCPDEVDGGEACPICDSLREIWNERVAQVRAAIQATFPNPNPQSRKS